jgi:hypothetical protein
VWRVLCALRCITESLSRDGALMVYSAKCTTFGGNTTFVPVSVTLPCALSQRRRIHIYIAACLLASCARAVHPGTRHARGRASAGRAAQPHSCADLLFCGNILVLNSHSDSGRDASLNGAHANATLFSRTQLTLQQPSTQRREQQQSSHWIAQHRRGKKQAGGRWLVASEIFSG